MAKNSFVIFMIIHPFKISEHFPYARWTCRHKEVEVWGEYKDKWHADPCLSRKRKCTGGAERPKQTRTTQRIPEPSRWEPWGGQPDSTGARRMDIAGWRRSERSFFAEGTVRLAPKVPKVMKGLQMKVGWASAIGHKLCRSCYAGELFLEATNSLDLHQDILQGKQHDEVQAPGIDSRVVRSQWHQGAWRPVRPWISLSRLSRQVTMD